VNRYSVIGEQGPIGDQGIKVSIGEQGPKENKEFKVSSGNKSHREQGDSRNTEVSIGTKVHR